MDLSVRVDFSGLTTKFQIQTVLWKYYQHCKNTGAKFAVCRTFDAAIKAQDTLEPNFKGASGIPKNVKCLRETFKRFEQNDGPYEQKRPNSIKWTDKQRGELIKLHFDQGLTVTEAAIKMGMPLKTAYEFLKKTKEARTRDQSHASKSI